MIVYGDPQRSASAEELADALRDKLNEAAALDDYRIALILAGQMEQAAADHFVDGDAIKSAQALTDACAAAFLEAFLCGASDESKIAFSCVADLLTRLGSDAAAELTVKVPEGFAFYTLFPEQYIASAMRWAEDHQRSEPKRVAIIGLRSIGTTLSSVVAQTLHRLNRLVRRVTVRPQGHPWDRHADLSASDIRDADFALVVDEGPGISGSSMAAVADALLRLGLAREQIAFFPAHDSEPGSAASDHVRACWRRTRRYSTDVTDLRLHGMSLHESLAVKTSALFGSPVRGVHDASGGLWRRFAFADEKEWPAVTTQFERTKLLVQLMDGRRVLWKFSGFVPDVRSLDASSDLTILPIAHHYGFTAMPWIDGTSLTREKVTPSLLRRLARHINAASSEPLGANEASAAFSRLEQMLRWNAREALGEEAQQIASSLAANACSPIATTWRRYGDGRLAPHEFICDATGQLHKADCGHDADHTIIGAQPLLWDIAGAATEWKLNVEQTSRLLSEANLAAPAATLRFYRAAYAAFRLGMLTLCPGDETEAQRTHAAQDFYRTALQHALTENASTSASNDIDRMDNRRDVIHAHDAD